MVNAYEYANYYIPHPFPSNWDQWTFGTPSCHQAEYGKVCNFWVGTLAADLLVAAAIDGYWCQQFCNEGLR
jgi:hypothetical protein